MRLKSGPPARYIKSQLELVPFINALEDRDTFDQGLLAVVIGFFPVSDDNKKGLQGEYAQLYNNVALKYELATFFISDHPDILEEFKIEVITSYIEKFLIDSLLYMNRMNALLCFLVKIKM